MHGRSFAIAALVQWCLYIMLMFWPLISISVARKLIRASKHGLISLVNLKHSKFQQTKLIETRTSQIISVLNIFLQKLSPGNFLLNLLIRKSVDLDDMSYVI